MAIVVLSEPFNKQCKNRNRKCVKAKCTLCGKEFEPRLSDISKIDSCGCGGRFRTTHGKSRSRVYKAWGGMIARCCNANATKFPLYGGRGIKVCDRWKDSFEAFLQDMGEPKNGESLDRIDPDGNYDPSNCRWAEVVTQNNNKRTNKIIEIDGHKMTVAEWVRNNPSVKYTTVTERLDRGWTAKEAVFGKCK